MLPTISVIITTYNYAHFIAGAIETVLGQTHPAAEVLVVDDGSTDDTAAIVARYAAAGVRYLPKPHGGISAARNWGIRHSQGDLIAFLDSDDRWVPDKLARQVDHLRRYPQVGLVTASEWQVYVSGAPPLYVGRTPVGAGRMYLEVLIENSIGNSSLVLVRRACFARVGLFDEAVGLGQDWDMWIRIARVFPIGVVDAPLLYFTRHEGSITVGKVWERYASNRAFHRRYIGQVRSPGRRLRLLAAAQSMNCYYTAATLVDDSAQRRPAAGLALAAVLLDPTRVPLLKLGVLFRAAFGRAAFDRLRAVLPARRAGAEAPPPPGAAPGTA